MKILLVFISTFIFLSCASSHIKTRYDASQPIKNNKAWYYDEDPTNAVLISGVGSAKMSDKVNQDSRYSALDNAILDAFKDIARQMNEDINMNLFTYQSSGDSGKVASMYAVETKKGDTISAELRAINYNKSTKMISVNLLYNGKNIKRMIK